MSKEEEKDKHNDKKPEKKWYKEGDESYLISYTKHLERKIRSLEAEKQLIESERIRLDRELRSIKSELDRMRQPPLVAAQVIRYLEDDRIIVKSSTGPRFVVKYSKSISKEELPVGTWVALNQRTFSIVEIIPKPDQTLYSAVKAWSGLPYDVKIIEVEEWNEIIPNLERFFFIRLKSLEDLMEIARDYRIPIIFKKDDEYLAIYYDMPLFWYKSKSNSE
ncbi:MAG: hypothetical protein HWN65_04880 [Candidatus Helarchaeota archaeon]|nr:hypothetical protein [Candidatus Helarchaeota archaeon]